MTLGLPSAVPVVSLALLITVVFGAGASRRQEPADERAYTGRLATVEPSARRISIIADGETQRVELVFQKDGQILQDSRKLSLSDLVLQVGSRVKVVYRVEDGVFIARSITVDPPRAG